MALRAGDLCHRVTLLDRGASVRSGTGVERREWVDREQRWARVEDLSAGLTYKAAMAGSRVRTMVTLREPVDLVPLLTALRFEERGRVRTLHVVEVRRMPSAEYVEVFCTEVAPARAEV